MIFDSEYTNDEADDTPDPREAVLPKALVVQLEGETLDEDVWRSGWNVVEHTDDPLSWLSVLENLLALDCVIVSPNAIAEDSQLSHDVIAVIGMVQTYLFVDVGHFLELLIVDDETETNDKDAT